MPQEVAAAWLKHLREELPTVAFKAATKKAGGAIAQARLPAAGAADASTSESLGADALLQRLRNYTRNAGAAPAFFPSHFQGRLVALYAVPGCGPCSQRPDPCFFSGFMPRATGAGLAAAGTAQASSSESLGAEALLQLLRNDARNVDAAVS